MNPDYEPSDKSSVFETQAEAKKRIFLDELRHLQTMPRDERQAALSRRQPLDVPTAADEEKDLKQKDFLYKFNHEHNYASNILDKVIKERAIGKGN